MSRVDHEYQRLPTDDDSKEDDGIRTNKPVPLECVEQANLDAKNQSSFNRLFCSRFLRISRILFSRSNPDGNLVGIWVTFILVSLLNEVAVYLVGSLPSRYYTVLIAKDLDSLKTLLIFSLFIVLGAGLGKSVVNFVGGIFSLWTRKILTKYLQNHYVHPNVFYRLLIMRSDIDNPDQRITQDVDKFANTLRLICEEIILSPILIVYYTYLTWRFCGFLGPLLIYSYFIIGAVASRFLIAPLVNLVFMKEFHEGNYRLLHVRIRHFAESIAFSLGEHAENMRLNAFFTKILNFTHDIIERELCLRALTESFSYLGSVVSYSIIAIPIFAGAYDGVEKDKLSEIISMNSFVTMYLIYRFTKIVDQSTEISDLAGYTARIGQVLEALQEINTELENVNIDYPFEERASGELAIIFDNVSFTSPSGHQLLSDFKYVIEQEKNLMIIGPNGSGKTSLLRVMCGIWPIKKGSISIPHNNLARQKMILYLPQMPYLVFGSLRDQLTYPLKNNEKDKHVTDDDVKKLLAQVNLTHIEGIIQNFDAEYGIDWEKMLSPGEQQKLAFARLFFWKPTFAALDESTSSLDSYTESMFFETCKELGITTITVSHNKNLLKYHDKVLLLGNNGSYSTSDIDINGCEDVERWINGTLRNFFDYV